MPRQDLDAALATAAGGAPFFYAIHVGSTWAKAGAPATHFNAVQRRHVLHQPRAIAVITKRLSCLQAHGAYVAELYGLYRSIVELHGDLTDFLKQLKDGDFLQCNLETVMMVSPGTLMV